jgi:hypothetical protein
LISVKDAHGEVINISYTKPEMNIRGTVTVSDTSSRKAILLTYNKENFLAESTTDPADRGLKVTVTYDRFGPKTDYKPWEPGKGDGTPKQERDRSDRMTRI